MKEGQPRHRSADSYPQAPKTRREVELEHMFYLLPSVVQDYISAIDGYAAAPQARKPAEKINVETRLHDLMAHRNAEGKSDFIELTGDMGAFIKKRNDRPK